MKVKQSTKFRRAVTTVLNHPDKQANFRKSFQVGKRRKKFFFSCQQVDRTIAVYLWFYGATIPVFSMARETLKQMSLAQRKRVLMAKWDRIVDEMRSRLQPTP